MANSIFKKCPWSIGANGILPTPSRTKEIFDIMYKTFLTKYKYESLKQSGNIEEASKYDLNNIQVFNQFANLAYDVICDYEAREYVLDTMYAIKENDFKRKTVKESYQTLYNLFVAEKKYETLKNALSENNQIIDLCYLFRKCNTVALTNESSEIKEMNYMHKLMKDMSKLEKNLS